MIYRVTDSKDNLRLGNKQKVSDNWIKNNLDENDIKKLKEGETIGVTIRKGRGYSHVTLIMNDE